MATLFINKGGVLTRLSETKSTQVSLNTAFSLEYDRIKIISNKFDLIGSSEIAIVNNIRTSMTKDISPDNLVYYDPNCKTKKFKKSFNYKYVDIKDFNPANYGNKVFFYTQSYDGNDINLCTNFYEIDKINLFNDIGSLLTFTSSYTNYGMYFNLAGQLIKGIGDIYNKLNFKKDLIDPHVVEFESDTLFEGKYLCLPEIDENEENFIIENCIICNEDLILKSTNEIYNKSFFILKLECGIKKDYLDFDFLSDSTIMLQKLTQKDDETLNKFVQNNKNSYELGQIKNILEKINCNQDYTNNFNKLSFKTQELLSKFLKI